MENGNAQPIVIRSSSRALYGKYILKILLLVILSVLSAFCGEGTVAVVMILMCFYLYLAARILWHYLRIKNTKYFIYSSKVEMQSYVFKFLGVSNNVANLSQVRQIQVFSNTYFDIWFFSCGKILLTVSGDIADFEFENIHHPGLVKQQIEKMCFGASSASTEMPGTE